MNGKTAKLIRKNVEIPRLRRAIKRAYSRIPVPNRFHWKLGLKMSPLIAPPKTEDKPVGAPDVLKTPTVAIQNKN